MCRLLRFIDADRHGPSAAALQAKHDHSFQDPNTEFSGGNKTIWTCDGFLLLIYSIFFFASSCSLRVMFSFFNSFQYIATFNKNTLKYLKIKHIKLPQTLPVPLSSQLSLAKVINQGKEGWKDIKGKGSFQCIFPGGRLFFHWLNFIKSNRVTAFFPLPFSIPFILSLLLLAAFPLLFLIIICGLQPYQSECTWSCLIIFHNFFQLLRFCCFISSRDGRLRRSGSQ